MPKFEASVPHTLGQATATERLRSFLEEVRRDHADKISNMHGEWNASTLDFAFTTYGMAVEGKLIVEDALVHVLGKLPLAAVFFRGQVEKTIKEELNKLLK